MSKFPQKIVLTGGGTAGHVILNVALLSEIKKDGYEVHYIGSKGIEKEILAGEDIHYHEIAVGKLRRYFSFQNFLDIIKVLIGCLQSLFILMRLRPVGIFSKGGFVAVPVCVAGFLLRIPVITHESDLTPGLATKIISRFSKTLFVSFAKTMRFFLNKNCVCVGIPLRQELKEGDVSHGRKILGLSDSTKPCLLIMGGSLGSVKINEAVAHIAPKLLARFDVIHLTGKGKKIYDIDPPGYHSFEYVKEDLPHFFAAADFVVSRSGAGSIFEFLQLRKPMLLIPLEAGSRGDQVENAEVFVENGWALTLSEKNLAPEIFWEALLNLEKSAVQMKKAMEQSPEILNTDQLWKRIKLEFGL